MSSTPTITDPTTWALDREIVLVRVLDATREAVFAAWTDADAFCQWFGPDGFTCTVREMDVRPGGRACFDMVSGDGTVFTNRFDYLEVVPVERLVLDHGSDADDDPARFRVTITLDEQADGKTVLTLRQLHPTVEQRDAKHRLRRGRARSADDAEARSPSRGRLNPTADEISPRDRSTSLTDHHHPKEPPCRASASTTSRSRSTGSPPARGRPSTRRSATPGIGSTSG